MLARYYSTETRGPLASHSSRTALSDRLLRESASTCIDTAQRISYLIAESLDCSPDPSEPSHHCPTAIGVLPWWTRIYYLHIAATHFLAAMCTSDLFSESIMTSWHQTMDALRAHEHLSEYVRGCVHTFETMAGKILGTTSEDGTDQQKDVEVGEGQDANEAMTSEDTGDEESGLRFEDIFHHLDEVLFGAELGMDYGLWR